MGNVNMKRKEAVNLGVVPFLNMRPLVYPIEQGLVKQNFNVMYFDPSSLSENLSGGMLDVAAIPSVEFLRTDEFSILPDISISSFGKVDSVILTAKKEITEIKSVSVDVRSRSSTALLRIVFELFLGFKPEYVKRKPGDGFLEGVDAGMLIGNSGLQALHLLTENSSFKYDLGELWTRETGLPFVYAVMAIKKENKDFGENYEALLLAKRKGTELIPQIAEMESKKLDLSAKQCSIYLGERIKYDFQSREIEGLMKYREFLFQLNEIERINEIDFYAHSQ